MLQTIQYNTMCLLHEAYMFMVHQYDNMFLFHDTTLVVVLFRVT